MYKVLLVDDDKAMLCGLRQYKEWKSCGFLIEEEAFDGKDALKKLSTKYFDLIVSDIRMPGMDGLRFLSEIKARNLDSCLMLMSTYNDFEYAQQGIRLGVFDYIVKPVKNEVLSESLKRIQRYLDEKRVQHTCRLEEKKMIIEDNLRFYFPKSQVKKLACLLLEGNYAVLDEAASTCSELSRQTNYDLYKMSLLLEGILQNVWEEMGNMFSWLAALEPLNFDDPFENCRSCNELKQQFIHCITIMLETVLKYELHHSDSLIRKACRFAMIHVEEDITLDSLAREIYISKNYIGKLFKQKTGCSFAEYVTKVKMEHAKYLLATGEYKNYEISDRLGYSSPDYFCRLFKGYTGHTPIEYRKMGT
ncbi:Hypothetical protein LUCI_5111 [Lucifera butyrica]|uniref:Stage 0 sporulation protein A homolog n=1 Tax=Lucifera butyrica TaxID=1351585 RepID=A0A498RI77_9FIRM|nr:response regulator [Lucifera butyrica]VBB09813.1 Hypothetical protein LUCI_5111 [Lucifera butyrica]